MKIMRPEFVFTIIITMFALFMMVVPARSHSWYDPDCCSDRDCAPTDSAEFTEIPGSDITKPRQLVVTVTINGKKYTVSPKEGYTKFRNSQDNKLHACVSIYMNPPQLICIYLPPGN